MIVDAVRVLPAVGRQRLKQALIDHLDKALKEGNGFSAPFRVYFFDPFTADLYRDVLANLPHDDCYHDLRHEDATRPDGTSTRTVMVLDGNAPPFWRDLSSILCGSEVEHIFRKYLGFGPARAAARLLRDFAGYRISPHPDSSKKACTVQFYLPQNDAQSDLGTSFFSRNADGSFVEGHKLPFLPNTGYAFRVAENSWHGTNFQVLKEPRNTLLITYYRA
jgi:hypothetical protein